MDEKSKLQLTSEIHKDGIIVSHLDLVQSGENTKQIARWVLNTQDEMIRKALIELGWKQPTDEGEQND